MGQELIWDRPRLFEAEQAENTASRANQKQPWTVPSVTTYSLDGSKVPKETPEGFLEHAQGFWAAADLALSKAEGVSLPAYFLLGRSLELSLKAFLLHKGIPISELRGRRYGHNLSALLAKSRAEGIDRFVELEVVDAGVICLLSYDYQAKRLEYRITKHIYALPLLPRTWEVARRLAYELNSAWKSSDA